MQLIQGRDKQICYVIGGFNCGAYEISQKRRPCIYLGVNDLIFALQNSSLATQYGNLSNLSFCHLVLWRTMS